MGNVESDTYWGSQIPRLVDYGRDRHLNVRGVKLFTDGKSLSYALCIQFILIYQTAMNAGALGSWGAALLAPYSDNPTTAGLMRSSADALRGLVEKFYEDGWQVVRLFVSPSLSTLMYYFVELRMYTVSAIVRTRLYLIYSRA